jgi:hypothetical protein
MVQAEIAGKPMWWALLVFVPIAGLVVAVIIMLEFVKRFGKGTGFGIFSIFFPIIAYPMLAFGKAQYQPLPGDPTSTTVGGGVPQQPVQPSPFNAPAAPMAPVAAPVAPASADQPQPPLGGVGGPTIQG